MTMMKSSRSSSSGMNMSMNMDMDISRTDKRDGDITRKSDNLMRWSGELSPEEIDSMLMPPPPAPAPTPVPVHVHVHVHVPVKNKIMGKSTTEIGIKADHEEVTGKRKIDGDDDNIGNGKDKYQKISANIEESLSERREAEIKPSLSSSTLSPIQNPRLHSQTRKGTSTRNGVREEASGSIAMPLRNRTSIPHKHNHIRSQSHNPILSPSPSPSPSATKKSKLNPSTNTNTNGDTNTNDGNTNPPRPGLGPGRRTPNRPRSNAIDFTYNYEYAEHSNSKAIPSTTIEKKNAVSVVQGGNNNNNPPDGHDNVASSSSSTSVKIAATCTPIIADGLKSGMDDNSTSGTRQKAADDDDGGDGSSGGDTMTIPSAAATNTIPLFEFMRVEAEKEIISTIAAQKAPESSHQNSNCVSTRTRSDDLFQQFEFVRVVSVSAKDHEQELRQRQGSGSEQAREEGLEGTIPEPEDEAETETESSNTNIECCTLQDGQEMTEIINMSPPPSNGRGHGHMKTCTTTTHTCATSNEGGGWKEANSGLEGRDDTPRTCIQEVTQVQTNPGICTKANIDGDGDGDMNNHCQQSHEQPNKGQIRMEVEESLKSCTNYGTRTCNGNNHHDENQNCHNPISADLGGDEYGNTGKMPALPESEVVEEHRVDEETDQSHAENSDDYHHVGADVDADSAAAAAEPMQALPVSEPQQASSSFQDQDNNKYDKPTVTTRFSDIIGHGAAKLRLDEMLLPLALPQSIADSILTGVRAVPASILLYGPPGTGKTKLASAVAGEAQAAFLSIGPSDILSKFVGESEASVKKLFENALKMAERMESGCCVIFFDEIDALGMSRNTGGGGAGSEQSGGGGGGENSSRRVLAELLIQLTRLSNGGLTSSEPSSSTKKNDNNNDLSEAPQNENENEMDCTITCTNENEIMTGERSYSGNGCNASRDMYARKGYNEGFLEGEQNQCNYCCSDQGLDSHGGSAIFEHFGDGDGDGEPSGSVHQSSTRAKADAHMEISNSTNQISQSSSASTSSSIASFTSASSEEDTRNESRCGVDENRNDRKDDTHIGDSEPASKPRIIVIAATNRPEDCDPALLRRFAIRVLVGFPSQRDRRKIISRLLEGIETTINRDQLKELAIATEGWSGSDLESVTREAVMAPLRECLRSAAIMKMKMRKKRKQKIHQSTARQNTEDDNQDDNTFKLVRDELLNGFKKLRPVTMKDFEEAVSFWIGDGQNSEQMVVQMTKQTSATCHYDSDSSGASIEGMD